MSTLPKPELWTPETIAEFHLNNAMNEEGYRWAIQEVIAMGLDPTKLDKSHLVREEPWQNPELYVNATTVKRQL